MVWLLSAGAYLWIKVLHIVAVMSWMAGMLYLPRLFVNHVGLERGSTASDLLKGMEHRLLVYIINPAMIVSWCAGLWMAWRIFGFEGTWLWLKLALVLALSGFHGYLAKAVRDFAADRNVHSSRYWRFMNEVPTLIMILVVILVIVKPF
ncbi:MAG: protoporphyrinogen oxidase HemJ [Ancalomicrobiaceae bacterium]|nr:protoporphyrinogen oxidase HemJ [Ancalomicrobiaceae bacterium]